MRARLLPIRALLLTTIGVLCPGGPSTADIAADSAAPREAAAPSCKKSCRGLGIEKVKAGDEHCGLVPRACKDESLDAACRLAESHREELRQRAREQAREKCAGQMDRSACRCASELHDWQNVYTHVLSQRCWAECGWAVLVECGRQPRRATADRAAPAPAAVPGATIEAPGCPP